MEDSAEFEEASSGITRRKRFRWWEVLFLLFFVASLYFAIDPMFVWVANKRDEAKWSRARTEMLEIGKELNLYAINHRGKLPPSLAVLTTSFPNGVPDDPFTKEPYVYKPSGDDFTLICLGLYNTKGGKESPEKDIVVNKAGLVSGE
ncbi:MAG: hypothetical protein L3J82_04635 [Planctomycetes bacterium]|nr:hypothetical protein [Planctomycetota bacterium]